MRRQQAWRASSLQCAGERWFAGDGVERVGVEHETGRVAHQLWQQDFDFQPATAAAGDRAITLQIDGVSGCAHQLGPSGVGQVVRAVEQSAPDAPGARGQGGPRCEQGRAAHAGCAAHHKHIALAAFVGGVRCEAGEGREDIAADQACGRRDIRRGIRRDAKIVKPQFPAILAPDTGHDAGLERQQREAMIGAHRCTSQWLTVIGIEAAGNVDGQHDGIERVH